MKKWVFAVRCFASAAAVIGFLLTSVSVRSEVLKENAVAPAEKIGAQAPADPAALPAGAESIPTPKEAITSTATKSAPPADDGDFYGPFCSHSRPRVICKEAACMDSKNIEFNDKLFVFTSNEYAERWFGYRLLPGHDREYLTGDWYGLRDKLLHDGVNIQSTYVADFNGNPSGGRLHGFRYNHSIGADLFLDLDKIAKFKGLQFHISCIDRAGRNLSKDCIGNTFVVSSLYGSEQIRLYSLAFDQSLLDNRAKISVGRIAAGDDFATDPLYWVFPNNAIDGNPIAVPINLPFTTYPTATWGVCGKFNFTKRFYTKLAGYNGDPSVGRMGAHGMDFTLRLDRGVLIANEFGYLNNQEKDDKGMPGKYKYAYYFHTGKHFNDQYEDINGDSFAVTNLPPKQHSGNYGMYWHADQMLYRPNGPGTYEGLTTFVVINIAPADINQFPFFVDGGIIYKGLIPQRKIDTSGVGFAYGKWSGDINDSMYDAGLDPKRYEAMLDFTYKCVLTDCFYLQPDVQYIMFPGGTGDIPNAFVLGFRIGLTF